MNYLEKYANNGWIKGMRDGIPIAVGYYAVSFSLGIVAGRANIPFVIGFFASLFTRASAGEYGVYSLAALNATYVEVVGLCMVANLRYMLMSAALTQKMRPGTSLIKRLLMACCMTDEVFGISMGYPGRVPARYPLGATLVCGTAWAAGTASGIVIGNAMPADIVTALSVSLYGMFIAIVVPQVRRDRAVAMAVAAGVVLSGLCAVLPWVSTLGSGTRTIILTIVISALAAWLRPIKEEEEQDGEA